MGRNVTYNILTNMPIKIVVGAYDTSATICWEYSTTICEDGCNSATTISTSCENIPLTPNTSCDDTVTKSGTITWNDKPIAYTIEQLPRDCDECGDIVTIYELTDYWLVPSVIHCDTNPNYNGKLYFEYYEIQEDDCQIISKEKKLGETAFTYDVCGKIDEPIHKEKNANIHIPNDDESIIYTVVCEYDCAACTECTPNSSSIIIGTITYDKSYVLCSGGDVNYTINYKIISYDKNCNKSTLNKIKTGKFTVPQCDGNCCKDHYAITSTTITETVGEQTLTETVSLSILMKKDYNNSCGEVCNQSTEIETKYCVDENSNSTVYYPTRYNGDEVWVTKRNDGFYFLNDNNEWVKVEGDGVGCVPKEGGKIKVEFQYFTYTYIGGTEQISGCGYRVDNDSEIYVTEKRALEAAKIKYPQEDAASLNGHINVVPCTTNKTLTLPMIQATCTKSPIEIKNQTFTYETANSENCNIVKYSYSACCETLNCRNAQIADIRTIEQPAGGWSQPYTTVTFTALSEDSASFRAVPIHGETDFLGGTTVVKTTRVDNSFHIVATVAQNTSTLPRYQNIDIYIGNERCTSVTVTQRGTAPVRCTCTNAQIGDLQPYMVSQPAGGWTQPYSAATFTANTTACANATDFRAVPIHGETDFLGDTTVVKTTGVDNSFHIVATMDRNDGTSPRTQDIELYVGNTSCGVRVTITQSGAMPPACECGNILDNTCMLTTLPLTSGEYEIGRGETYSCGYFTASSTSDQVTSVNVETEGGISTFYATVKYASSEGASSDIDIYFIYNDGVEGQENCHTTRTITQTAYYVSCERFSRITIEDSILYYHEDSGVREIAHLDYSNTKDFYAFYMKGLIEFTTYPDASDWLSDIQFFLDGSYGVITATVSAGPDNAHRTTTIMASLKEEEAKEYGICNCTHKVTWELTQYCTCNCVYYDTHDEAYEIIMKGETGSTHVTTYNYPNKCFTTNNIGQTFILIYNGTPINCSPSSAPSDLEWHDLPTNVSEPWFHVTIYPEIISEGHTEYHTIWMWDENNTRNWRDISITQQLYLKAEDGGIKTCQIIRNFRQSYILPKTCENYFAQTLYNVKSGNTSSSSMIRYDGIDPTHSGGVSIAAYHYDYPGGVDRYELRGEVTDGSTWLRFTNYEGNVLYANVDENIKKPLSKDNDGSTEERHCNIRIWLVDADGNVAKDMYGNPCTGVTADTYQEGFSGYCPVCSSMHSTDIDVNYRGYGEMQCDGVPAFHGNGSTQLSLFECNLSHIIKTQDRTQITCFGLLAETDHTNFVDGTLTAVTDGSSSTKYIVKGVLKANTNTVTESIAIRLYLTKRNFITGEYERCNETLTEGHIKLLPNGQTSCD